MLIFLSSKKPPFFFMSLLTILSCLASSASAQNWQLVWSDEFNGAAVDQSKWEFQLGDGTTYGIPGWGNNELQWYRQENAVIENGFLIITAKRESFAGFAYTSTRLRTRNKGDWKYGRVEMRAKLPFGKGIWPAFWMLPTDNVYGGWAASGEIDIMELVGHEPHKTHGTLHYGGQWPNNTSSGTFYSLPAGKFSDDFHVFALEWKPGEMRWYVDNVHYQTQTSWWSAGGPFPAPFDQRFHILLNVAVGGNWPGAPDASTVFPQRLEVDYVRVYQDAGATEVGESNDAFLPKKFSLHQNFPNPFNPATVIRYDLPQPDSVVLEVFDLFGQKVQTLINQQQRAGQYSISFDGRSLSSGVYVYKIKTAHFQQANKMLLVR
jgi:beta-glucanase (GH16 family)